MEAVAWLSAGLRFTSLVAHTLSAALGLGLLSTVRILRKAARSALCVRPGSARAHVLRMRAAATYEEWAAAARALDMCDGGREWRGADSAGYDSALILDTTLRLQRLRSSRAEGAPGALMLTLSACMSRAFGGIGSAGLHQRSALGTKDRIEAFVAEVCASIDAVAENEELAEGVRLAFLESARGALGRTGLALSGGGSLALSHAGVVRCLLLNGLLPRVISGASGGAIMAGIIALHTDEELIAGEWGVGSERSGGRRRHVWGREPLRASSPPPLPPRHPQARGGRARERDLL